MISHARAADSPRVRSRLKAKQAILFWSGCAMTGLGAAAIIVPELGTLVIGGFAGWLLWLAGAIMLAASLLIRSRPFLFGVLSSLVAIAAGMFLLFNPGVGALAVALLAAAVFLVDGAFQLALALDLRPLRVWRWILASALASGMAAILAGAGFSTDSAPAFGMIVGLATISTGWAFIRWSEAVKNPSS